MKNKIKTGDRITLRNGKKFIAIFDHPLFKDILVSLEDGKHISLTSYDEYLRVKRDVYNKPWGENDDIIRIERVCNPSEILSENPNAVIVIWDEKKNPIIPKDCLDFLQQSVTISA